MEASVKPGKARLSQNPAGVQENFLAPAEAVFHELWDSLYLSVVV